MSQSMMGDLNYHSCDYTCLFRSLQVVVSNTLLFNMPKLSSVPIVGSLSQSEMAPNTIYFT